MEKRILRILALAAVFALLAAAGCAPAEEEQTFRSGDYSCVLLEDGTAEIVRYTGSEEELEIPAELEGKPVTAIGNAAFSGRKKLKSVTIPETVSRIGSNPFTDCESFAGVTVPKGHPYLATIYGVLYSKADKRLVCCPTRYSASEYAIPQGIRTIGDDAFYGVSSLQKITIPDSVTVIGASAFSGCSGLTELLIPDGVTEIGPSAFNALYYLEKITIPGSVKELKDQAFAYCGDLKEAVIGEGVQVLGDQVFHSCDDLKKISLPDSLTKVGVNPFSDCDSLTEIILAPDHPYLSLQDGVLFSKPDHRLVFYRPERNDTEYVIPEGTEIIGSYAFYHAGQLNAVQIPGSVRSLEPYAFTYSNLSSVTLPDGFVSVGPSAFESCYALERAVLPDTLTEIGPSAFASCSKLTEITIPAGVTAVGELAFYHCTALSSLSIPESVSFIGEDAFAKCSSLTLTVPWGSYAEEYCKSNYYKYVYAPVDDDLSWLND